MSAPARNRFRALWILGILMVVLIGVGVTVGADVWQLIITKRVHLRDAYPGLRSVQNGEPVRGWYRIKRWAKWPNTRHGRGAWFYESTGKLAGESFWKNGQVQRRTQWNLDGTVQSQWRLKVDGRYIRTQDREKTEPPWWWGATDHSP